MFLWDPAFNSSERRSAITGLYKSSIFTFCGISKLFRTAAAPLCTPTDSTQGFQFLHGLTNTFFNSSTHNGVFSIKN